MGFGRTFLTGLAAAIFSFQLTLLSAGAQSLLIDTFKVTTFDGVPLTVVRYLCPEVPLGTPMVRIEGTGATTWLGQNPMKEICAKEGAAYLVHQIGRAHV